MKSALTIFYWIFSILLLASVLTSLGYMFTESIFIASLFLPGAIATKYLFPKVSFSDKKKGILNSSYITVGIIVTEILLFFLAHWYISTVRAGARWYEWPELPKLMYNPIFISIMIGALSVGNYYFGLWLERKFPSEEKPVTFLSNRRQISLMRGEILYIESNDSITTVYAIDGRSYMNKTAISQWEDFLGRGFLRIHRSYLVNVNHISKHSSDSVFIGEIELPVSRKYKDSVKSRT